MEFKIVHCKSVIFPSCSPSWWWCWGEMNLVAVV